MIDINKQYKYKNTKCFKRIVFTNGSDPSYPVVSETTFGRLMLHRKDGTHVDDPGYDLIEVGKYDHLKKGDPVIVAGKIRVFAGIDKDGDALTYTKVGKHLVSWNKCRKATEEDLE